MRSTEVFICSSIEEGFGLPGFEALICGQALATTDTKGSRDYAIHNKTALVSEPEQPEKLAENIINLLENNALRSTLKLNSKKHINNNFSSWEDMAKKFYNHLISF